ncbi:MAG: division/cell wall cluster transcriptional repressor MraZ [Thermoleophilaceae bacterium]
MAFRGHFEYSLDAKNRLNIPPKFRAQLSEGLVLMKWFEPCLALFPVKGFDAFTDSFLPDLNPISEERRRLTRYLAGSSYDAELDAAGRVTLTGTLIKHASLDREVAIVGNIDYLEIWDRSRYEAEQDELPTAVADIARSLGHPS